MDESMGGEYLAFVSGELVVRGGRREVARALRERLDAGEETMPVVVDAVTSRPAELDLRGSVEEVLARIDAAEPVVGTPAPRGPGRPRLGVVAREVTLLPRHWEWLAAQRGGASATLRRLVDDARRESAGADRVREAQEAAYRFMFAVAGDEPGFEEASRALFAGDAARFADCVAGWPRDVREHALVLARAAFEASA